MSATELLDQLYAEHLAAHGPDCGVHAGSPPPEDVCRVIRRAWARTHPHDAERDNYARWYADGGRAVRAAYEEGHGAYRRRKSRERYWANPEAARAANAAYRAANLEERRRRDAERRRERWAEDPEYRKREMVSHRRWVEAHREQVREYQKAYKLAHRTAA